MNPRKVGRQRGATLPHVRIQRPCIKVGRCMKRVIPHQLTHRIGRVGVAAHLRPTLPQLLVVEDLHRKDIPQGLFPALNNVGAADQLVKHSLGNLQRRVYHPQWTMQVGRGF